MPYDPHQNLITAGAVAFGLTAWSGSLLASDTHTIKFRNVISAGDTQNQGYELFAEQVAGSEPMGGLRSRCTDSQLGGEREMIEPPVR
ncbi:hypothetical protein DSL92_04780 [Billgrantia gudaonensis]|uniref:Uncharacterized protein n=1 Tax=Billgrantia gudaonensis TaxID=376427 RepID=A0A432JJ92_9GAMM|nr:hypothetical protein DSL92_04780 [Halomonas gudaonensis]